jgi:hypothetical protein
MEDELKWMTPRKSWKYIPNRHQVLVTQFVAALLIFNIFEILFQPTGGSGFSGACGTLLRPVVDDQNTPGWLWNSGPWSVNMSLGCPRHIYQLWHEFFASFVGLAVCGVVLRNAIKRMPSEHREATKNL